MALLNRFSAPGPGESGIDLGLFVAFMEEAARGKVTIDQLQTVLRLDAAGFADAQALYLGAKNGTAAFSGTTPFLRSREIESVLTLWVRQVPPYDNEAAVRARLGLP